MVDATQDELTWDTVCGFALTGPFLGGTSRAPVNSRKCREERSAAGFVGCVVPIGEVFYDIPASRLMEVVSQKDEISKYWNVTAGTIKISLL